MKPENPKKANRNVQSGTSEILQGSRNVKDFLPSIFKTPTNNKFLNSTLENLFSSGTTENIDAYWGKIDGSVYDYENDVYNKETTALRQNYQFVNGFKSRGENFDTITSYINTIKKLTNDGYITDDIDRLTAEREYILDLPINHDMFVNYLNYHWLVDEIPVCEINATSSDPIDIDNIVLLNSYTTPVLENGKTLEFVNGLRVKFVGQNVTSSSGEYSVNSVYFVEGIGSGRITLVEQYNSFGKNVFPRVVPYTPNIYADGWDISAFDSLEFDDSVYINILKEYSVIDRRSKDKNPWSRINKWYSIYAIRATAEYNDIAQGSIINEKTSAKRPIIQFDPDIELYENGIELKVIVDHHIDGVSASDIIGNETFFNNNYYLEDGDYVLITDFENSDNYDIYVVYGVGTYINLGSIKSSIGIGTLDKILIMHSNISEYIANELYYENGKLKRSYQKLHRSDSPKFNLYDAYSTNLAQYEDTTFKGNSIFEYKTSDSSIVDLETGLRLVTDSSQSDQYMLDLAINQEYSYSTINGIISPIEGDYFFKVLGNLRSVWSPSKDIQRSKVSEVFVVEDDSQVISHTISPIAENTEFIVQLESDIKWYEKKYGYIYGDGELNPNIHLLTNTNYILNIIDSNSLYYEPQNTIEITDPFGNQPVGVNFVNIKNDRNVFLLTITGDYEYDTLIYKDNISGKSGYIFIEDSYNYYTVLKNGTILEKDTDYTITNNFVQITTDLVVGDVIEFNYYSDDKKRPRDVASSFKHNPLNEKVNEIGFTEIKSHIIEQNVSSPYTSGVFVGDNDYHKMPKPASYGGSIRQQLYSPAPHSIFSSNDNFDVLLSLDILKDDYEGFKNIFKNKISQLWKNGDYYNIRDLVDDALSQINIGKDETFRYAHSDMAFYDLYETYTYAITDTSLSFQIPFVDNNYGNSKTKYQLWVNTDGNDFGEWIPLINDIDFTVTFDRIQIDSSVLGQNTDATIELRKYDNSAKSYIPYSPAKLGIVGKHKVSISGDYLVCHDGSLHKLSSNEIFNMRSSNFDVMSAAIYDLETRISNNLVSGRNDIRELLPSQNSKEFMSYSVFNSLMKSECVNWASSFSNGYEEERIEPFDPADKFTFNYKNVTNYESYKSLYKYMFNTDRPHTHPWEMFGYSEEPDWWADTYSWTDLTKREKLLNSLKNGIVDSSLSKIDVRYSYYDYNWTNNVLVTETGELNDPITAKIVNENVLGTNSLHDDFKFGNYMFAVEQDWTQTSSYIFSLLKVFMKLKPYKIWNLYWIKNDLITVSNSNKEYEIYETSLSRNGIRSEELHLYKDSLNHVYDIVAPNSVTVDGFIIDIVAPMNENYGQARVLFDFDPQTHEIFNARILDSGYGYRSDFPMIIRTSEGTYTSNIIAKVERTPVKQLFGINAVIVEQYSSILDISELFRNTQNLPVIHMGGFTKSDLIKLELDGSYNKGSISIPKEDYGIRIIKSPPSKKIHYSGLMVKTTEKGEYVIDGYNKDYRYFNIIPVNVSGSQSEIEITRSVSVKRYNKFHNRIERIPYGTKFKKRQDLYSFMQGLEQYYKSVGFHNLQWNSDSFDVIKWAITDVADTEIAQIMVSGIINDKIIFQHGSRGFVDTFTEYSSIRNPIYDNIKFNISPTDLLVIRDKNFTEVSSKRTIPSDGKRLFGITFEVVEYEHLLYINPTTKFNDIVLDSTAGIFNSRIKIKGERTRDWNGRTETPGFLISYDSITNNFDSNAREIEQDVMNSYSRMLDPLTRETDKFTVGYQQKPYFIDIGSDETSAYEFYKGVRKYKGTQTSINALLRNKNIFAKNADSISEEWLIYSKDYGNKEVSNTIKVEVPRSLVKTDPQTIRFVDTSTMDNPYDSVIDISSGSSRYISGNWENPIPTLPAKKFTLQNVEDIRNFEEFAKTSGIPIESEVDYTVAGIRDMLNVYEYTSDYANVPLWSNKISYKKGDIVRKGPRVYQYLLDSTGLPEISTQSYIRGNVTFPEVESGSTLIIGTRQPDEDALTYTTVTFNKTQGLTEYLPYELIASVPNPTTDVNNTIVIDGNEIVFSSSTSSTVTPTNNTITAIGTLENFSVLGNFYDQIIIDDHRIRLSYVSTNDNSVISLFSSLNLTATELANLGLNSANVQFTSIATKMSLFREAYIAENSLQDWYEFLTNYYSGIYEDYGFNINYLTSFYSGLTGFESYYSAFENFYQNEIDIYDTLFSTSIVKGETVVPQVTLNNMIQFIQQTFYIGKIVRYIKSGGPINGSDLIESLGTIGLAELQSNAIVEKINNYFNLNGLADQYIASIDNNKLKITKYYDLADTSGQMTIIVDATDTNLGFTSPINAFNAFDELQTSLYFVSINNMVNVINSFGISGVSASIHTDINNNDQYLKLTSNNPTLSIGAGTANSDIGLSEQIYNAEFIEGTVLINLDVNDVVEQINDTNIPNVVAANVNNSVVLTAVVSEFDIGAGTANSALGFTDIDPITAVVGDESVDTAFNYFNFTEWTSIDDPINFSVWVNDNLDPIIANTNRNSGYNVYQTMDFDLEIYQICPGVFSNDDAMVKFLKPHNLQVNDYVVLTATNSTPSVDGIHRVTGVYSDTIVFIESYIKNNGSYGKCFPLRPVRFSNTQQMLDSGYDAKYHFGIYGWKPGMYAYVDSYENTGVPAAYRCTDVDLYGGVYFELVRKFENLADNYKLKSAYVYNYKTYKEKTSLEVFDPVKGIIPGVAELELTIKSVYDNARYTDSTDTDEDIDPNNYWSDEHVGETWWDMSTAIYLEYEQGDLDYRQQNWGKLYPTASIDVYEWTKSTVPPDEYENEVTAGTVVDGIQLSGTPYYRIGQYGDREYYWTEKTYFDRSRGISETYYYYWVKNKTTVPSSSRKYTTVDLENIIENPSNYGINWIAAVSNNAVIVSDLSNCLSCDNAVLDIWFDTGVSEYHKEYILLSEDEKERRIPKYLHDSLRDSLSGYTDMPITLDYSIWLPLKDYKKDDVVKYENKYYIATADNKGVTPVPQDTTSIIYQGEWQELLFIDKIKSEEFWNINKYGYTYDVEVWDHHDWSKSFPDNVDDVDGELVIKSLVSIPDYTKHPLTRYGIYEHRQSWFKNLTNARREFVYKINSVLKTINMMEIFSTWYDDFNKEFHATGKEFSDKYTTYKLSDMYYYTDWVSNDYKNITKINYNLNTTTEMQDISPVDGDIVRILNDVYGDGIKRKKIYRYVNSSWELLYHEKATMQFLDEMWNPNISSRNWDDSLWDISEWDRDTGPYFYKLVDLLYDSVFGNTLKQLYNETWFTMLKYVHTEQDFVRWAVKSSYFKFVLENDLSENKKYKKDNIQSILDYINDVKPFSSKMRKFSNRKYSQDSASINISELGDSKNVTLNYSDVAAGSVYTGDAILTNTFGDQGDIDTVTSDMTTTEYDFIYDGNVMDYSNEKFSEELIPSRMRDAVGIFITRNEVGDTETDTTKQYVIHVNNKSKISYSISENTDVSQLTNNILKTDTTIEVDDGSKFLFNSESTISKSSGVAWINGERIEYKNVIGNILLNCVRGTGGTAPQDHSAGDNILYANIENSDYPPIELSTIMYDAANYN